MVNNSQVMVHAAAESSVQRIRMLQLLNCFSEKMIVFLLNTSLGYV